MFIILDKKYEVREEYEDNILHKIKEICHNYLNKRYFILEEEIKKLIKDDFNPRNFENKLISIKSVRDYIIQNDLLIDPVTSDKLATISRN